MRPVFGEREVLPRLDDVFLALVADHAFAVKREDQRSTVYGSRMFRG